MISELFTKISPIAPEIFHFKDRIYQDLKMVRVFHVNPPNQCVNIVYESIPCMQNQVKQLNVMVRDLIWTQIYNFLHNLQNWKKRSSNVIKMNFWIHSDFITSIIKDDICLMDKWQETPLVLSLTPNFDKNYPHKNNNIRSWTNCHTMQKNKNR